MLIMSDKHAIGKSEGLLKSILGTLAYFDVFGHPLTLAEIREFNRIPSCNEEFIESALMELISMDLVHTSRGFFFLGNDGTVVDRRIAANNLARKRMQSAWHYSTLIARFPFIRAVMISGSLSKGVMDADDDIDFFILTAPGRLWIARVMLTIYKRIFLLNSHRNFCLNYFVDEDHLTIPDQNIFTATEIGLILPMYNRELYRRFLNENAWFRSYYPNLPEVVTVKNNPDRFLAELFEMLFSGRLGNKLDDYCMNITRRFLARKYRNMKPERFDADLETSKSVSKHHPNSQQFRVLDSYRKISRILEKRLFNILTESDSLYRHSESA